MRILDRLEQLARWPLAARVRVALLCFLAANLLLLFVVSLFSRLSAVTIVDQLGASQLVRLLSVSALCATALGLMSYPVERKNPGSGIYAVTVAVVLSGFATAAFILLGLFSAFPWATLIAVAGFGFAVFKKRLVWMVISAVLVALGIYSLLIVSGHAVYRELIIGGGPGAAGNPAHWMLFHWSTTGVAAIVAIWFIGVILGKWHERERALLIESETDALTTLLNRRSFFRRCNEIFDRRSHADQPVSVALFDLDHFKQINDRHGHDAGDATLVEVAKTIRRAVREGDIVARFGGEEIVVVLPGCNLQRACDILERCRSAISELVISNASRKGVFHVTTSIGVTCAPNYFHESIEELIRHADEALYRAKDTGRNRIVVWGN